MIKPIKNIVHLADIHIRKNPSRNKEYENVFNSLFESLRKKKPDLIVIVGDILHDYIDMQSETILLASKFLRGLTDISDVIVTQGNHDKILKGGDNRVDAIEALVGALDIKNLTYLNKTGFFDVNNITFAVWHHADKKSPYDLFPEYISDENKTLIDLFHDPINESSNYLGYVFNDKSKRNISEFKGEFSFFGDIHKRQFLSENKAYCGSLIQQDFGELPENHGYLFWDIENKTCEEVDIENDYVYETIMVKENFNYNKMNIKSLYPKAKYLSIKVLWCDLSFNRTQEREMLIKDFLTKKYKPFNIKIEKKAKSVSKKRTVDNSGNIDVNNLAYISKRYETYLKDLGYKEDIISKVLTLEETITNRLINKKLIDKKDFVLTSLLIDNFQQYDDDVLIDFENKLGLTQIIGNNQVGKSTIFDAICYALYGKTLGTLTKEKNGDRRYVNNRRKRNDCSVTLSVKVNDILYNIKRTTSIVDDKVNNSLIVSSDEADIFVNGKSKTETQVNLENIFGGFDEFILLHLTNGSNLEKILSVDRSEFLDSLANNLGLGIFELKVSEFKEWRSESKKENYLSLNPEKEKKYISEMEVTNNNLNELYKDANNKLIHFTNEIGKTTKIKEENLAKLHNLGYNDVIYDKVSLENEKNKIEDSLNINNLFLKVSEKEISKLKSSYDNTKLDKYKSDLSEGNNIHYKFKNIELNIRERILDATSKVKFKEMSINSLNELLNQTRLEYKNINNAKNCTLCGELLKGEHLLHIEENKGLIKGKGVSIGNEIKTYENEIKLLKIEIDNCDKDMIEVQKNISERIALEEEIMTEIAFIEKDKESFEMREKFIVESKQKKTENDLFLLELENIKNKINEYVKNESNIIENKNLNKIISELNGEILSKNKDTELLRNQLSDIHTSLIKNNELIKQKQAQLTRYFEIKTEEEIESIYLKMIHRGGLPFEILKEYIPIINDFLETLLSDVNFNIFFDENIKLKIKKENGSIQDVLQGSGMEKSFISFILKIAMIQTNNNNRFDFIMLDEVMDKLDANNLEHFIQVLNKTKEWISKIFIINHLHNIYPDFIIEPYITKDGLTNINTKNNE